MNKDKILALADAIEANHAGIGFTMATTGKTYTRGELRTDSIFGLTGDELTLERLNFLPRETTTVKCGAAGCIAGWAVFKEHGKKHYEDLAMQTNHSLNGGEIIAEAADILGLDRQTACFLFLGNVQSDILKGITPAEAVETLRKLAETGEVDWSHSKKGERAARRQAFENEWEYRGTRWDKVPHGTGVRYKRREPVYA